jgi:hypothetical protein
MQYHTASSNALIFIMISLITICKFTTFPEYPKHQITGNIYRTPKIISIFVVCASPPPEEEDLGGGQRGHIFISCTTFVEASGHT